SVSPGTLVRINSKMELRERSLYAFDIEGRKARESIDVNVFLEELESRLIRSISRRLHADVSVGAYLSSGVDSSLVCAISAKKLGLDPKCFSAGFTNVSDNETIVAEKIANHLGLPFEAYYISQDDLLTAVTQFGKNLDEPNGDRSCVPTYFLSALISSQVRVAVSGDGGDELFGGYGRYQDLNHQLSPKKMIQSYFNERLPMFPANVLEQVLPHSAEVFRKKFVSRYLSAFERTDLLDIERMRLMDFYSYLPGAVLAKVDRMSMKNSLEVRTPFLDPAILEMSTFLPATLIHQEGLLKMALRKILAKYLPAELILPNKQGFGMPASFFNSYASVFNRLLTQADETLAAWSGFDFDRSAFTTLQQASRNSINTIWCWISLAQWSESLPAVTRLGKSEGVAV
ncbi:MAG: asparagine synthase C-terminal domain-containing protein, partial [Gammaproteobacteria bacterium]|nr:asparagine synthase C-terminal domain-containing protein [Gammaproteobacteria bacterium]